MRQRQRLPAGALILGGVMAGLGAAFVAMYVLEAVVARWGEPDQSLLFWYLPLLFLGVIAGAVGAGIGFWGWRRRPEHRAAPSVEDAPANEELKRRLE